MRQVAAVTMALVATMASMQAQAESRYGSIAFSQDQGGGYGWGITWNARSREAARSRAVAKCRSEGGERCKEFLWFRNTCAALAVGGGNGSGASTGASKAEAQRAALEQCRIRNEKCRITVARCATASAATREESLGYSSSRYGALAFAQRSDGGFQWGVAWDVDNPEGARSRAIGKCRDEGPEHCKKVLEFRNTCGALAISGTNGWGASTGASKAEAQRGALDRCGRSNRNCRIAVARCAKSSATVATAGSLGAAKVGSTGQGQGVARLTRDARRKIQRALAASGHDPGGADGVFGPKTRAAVRAWQSANGYTATGQLTGEQARALQSGKRRTRPAAAPTLAEAVAAYKRRDYATALKGFYFHAQKGDAAAQTNLALLYAKGQGVARNDTEAVRWLKSAARQGYANARTHLGVMYESGRGVRRDLGEALRLYRLAAAQGETYAQNNLGNMYASGRGVARDEKEAERWYGKAAARGHADARASLKKIADARRKNTGFVTPPPPKRNLAEIMHAEGAHLSRVAKWLEEGHDPNARNQGGDTPLHFAAAKAWPDGPKVVRLLIAAGARCDARNERGNTPLHVAAGAGTTPPSSTAEAAETVRLLIDCGADPSRRNNDGNAPLHTAFTGIAHFTLGAGDHGVVGALLRGGAKPNTKNNDGDAPLMLAVKESDAHAKTVRVLLEHGASPDTRNRKGSSALHVAAEEEHPLIIAALLAAGAEPDARDRQGDAALHIAVKKRRERAEDVEALLAGGADPCVRDRKRNIPIAYPEEGSRANRLLASAGGQDWDCDEESVAEAPKQKPKEAADRSKATTATGAAAAQSGTPVDCLVVGNVKIEQANSKAWKWYTYPVRNTCSHPVTMVFKLWNYSGVRAHGKSCFVVDTTIQPGATTTTEVGTGIPPWIRDKPGIAYCTQWQDPDRNTAAGYMNCWDSNKPDKCPDV